MNTNYIARALCYHGPPLQKIWDDERGVEELRRLNLTQLNYSIYQERQKYFTFQERAKRLKVHQFLARKAIELYDKQLVGNVMEDTWLKLVSDFHVSQPPLEYFMNVKDKDKRNAWAYRMGALKQGDIICAMVQKIIVGSATRIVVKPLCTAEPLHFYLADIPIKAIITHDQLGPLPLDRKGNPRPFAANDFIRCEVCNVSADVERLSLGMLGVHNKNPYIKLGLCDFYDFPKFYRQIHNKEHSPEVYYEDELGAALEFENPNYDVLFQMNGLQPDENLSFMSSSKVPFPESDYASELRQKQATQWAFRYVADGIEHFKNGQQIEAFQCLNRALVIDPRNVEGLVARGALYANRGSFLKGLKDFEKALTLNKYHVNARKYMGETLVALGRSYEEENRIPDAIKAYSDCLNLLPQHEQARISLDALQQKATTSNLMSLLNLPKTVASSDDSSSTSDSDDGAQKQKRSGKSRSHSSMEKQDKRAVSDALSANEFKLDDDETMSSVRKLLREASKHKKSKKKTKKKKDKEKNKKTKHKSTTGNNETLDLTEAALQMLKKMDYADAFRLISSNNNDQELKDKLELFFNSKQKSNSPTPPITMRKQPSSTAPNILMGPSTSKHAAAAASANIGDEEPPPAPKFHDHNQDQHQQKLSFQIKKRPLQMDKFGLLRLVTPLSSHSQSRSRSRSRSSRRRISRSRSRTRRISRRRGNSRSRSRSRSRSSGSRGRFRRSRSRRRRSPSRSRSYSPARYGGGPRYRGRGSWRNKQRFANDSRDRQSRSRSFVRGRRTPSPFVPRRTPSPFVPRRTPSPTARYRRTRSRSFSPRRYQAPRYVPRGRGRGRFQHRWNFDHRTNERRYSPDHDLRPPGVEHTTEGMDENYLKDAQKERKQGIIEGDRDISGNNYS